MFLRNSRLMALAVCLCGLPFFANAQWGGTTNPWTGSDPEIESLNPDLQLDIESTGTRYGGLEFLNSGTSESYFFYEKGSNVFGFNEDQSLTNPYISFDLDNPAVTSTLNGGINLGRLNGLHLSSDGNEIQAKSGTANSDLFLNFWGSSTWIATGNNDGDFAVGSGNDLYVDNSAGRVGMGLSAPADELHIFNSAAADIRLQSAGSKYLRFWEDATTEHGFMGHNGVQDMFMRNRTSGGDLYLQVDNGSTASTMMLESGGDLGLGTLNPTSKIHTVSTGSDGIIVEASNYPYLRLNSTGGSEDMTLNFLEAGVNRANVGWEGSANFLYLNTGINASTPTFVIRDNRIGINNDNPGAAFAVDIDGDVNIVGELTASSDRRLKKNIENIADGLDLVSQLRPVHYDFRTDEFAEMNLPDRHKMGLIAQEVQEILPALVTTGGTQTSVTGDSFESLSVNYVEIVPLLIASVQELKAQLEQRDAKIADLESDIDGRLARLEALLSTDSSTAADED